jgi:hypothetical protein
MSYIGFGPFLQILATLVKWVWRLALTQKILSPTKF